MRVVRRLAASFALLAGTVACGLDGNGASPSAELMGSCEDIADWQVCQEFDEGRVASADEHREDCLVGNWTESACPTEGQVSVCRMSGSFGGARTFYYAGGDRAIDHPDLRETCQRATTFGQHAEYELLGSTESP